MTQTKLIIYGPVQLDCVNDYWQVVRNDIVIETFATKKEALEYAHTH